MLSFFLLQLLQVKYNLTISIATSVMKTIFFLCCVAVFAAIVSSDDSEEIDEDIFERAGLKETSADAWIPQV
ncbi:UNVERIFIED_CONTAM: hypothetical protein NCL1_53450 [Trichonephila clavipes]